ncbi:TPA: phage tail tip fiber protein, partial [Providencia alcalifaciens]
FIEVSAAIEGVEAGVIKHDKAIVDINKSIAESETQVQAKFEKQGAMINTKMQAEFEQDAGYAMHSTNITIVVDDKKYNAAGMVISAELKNGKIESFIGFNANNFAFYNPVNEKMEPFLYMKNGQVFMNEAFISKAWLNEVVVTDKMTSANYVPGKMGFNIDAKTGEVECHSILISGDFRIVSDDGQLLVDKTGVTSFDENGRWTVKLGKRPV